MRVDSVCLREIAMRLRSPFETSFGSVQDRRILLVKLSADGVDGWGESTAMEGPFFNSETIDIAWLMLRDYLIPRVLGKEVAGALEIPELLRSVRGHEMAKAALETSLWDLEAKTQGIPLWRALGGTLEEIACGVSLGIKASTGEMVEAVEREVAAGYQRIKLKIKPGKDIDVVREVRGRFPEIRLSVDANSAYTLDDADHLRQLDEFNLLMIEQPLAWDDLYAHSKLQQQLRTPICLDESIHNLEHAVAAIEMGSCRVINIKLGRVGGHQEASRIQAFCADRGVPVWCGGMIESGVGRAHNIAMSTQAGFIWPGDVSASQRYWREDIIEPEVTSTSRGTIEVPQSPGIGYRVREDLIEKLTVREERFGLARIGIRG